MSREIFAHHAHVFPAAIRADGTVDALLRTMDACGIARCVAFAPFSGFVGDLNANRWLCDALRGQDRLEGFGIVNFTKDDLEDQVDEIASLGFRGIKIHPAFQEIDLLEARALRVYARAQLRGLFLTFHTGTHWYRLKSYNQLAYDEIAWQFPGLRFSMEHVGGYCFFHDAVAVMINNAHRQPRCVYAGMTSVCDPDMNRNWYLSDQQIRDLIWQTGADGLLFGLDFPYNDASKIRSALERFDRLALPEETMDGLLGGNLARALQR